MKNEIDNVKVPFIDWKSGAEYRFQNGHTTILKPVQVKTYINEQTTLCKWVEKGTTHISRFDSRQCQGKQRCQYPRIFAFFIDFFLFCVISMIGFCHFEIYLLSVAYANCNYYIFAYLPSANLFL